jgi:Leucine-rich repeat (LRR) protein
MKKNIFIGGIVFQVMVGVLLLNGMEEKIQPEHKKRKRASLELKQNTNQDQEYDSQKYQQDYQQYRMVAGDSASLKTFVLLKIASDVLYKSEKVEALTRDLEKKLSIYIKGLQIVKLNGMALEKFDFNLFAKKNITSLDLSKNTISNLPDYFDGLSNLKDLDLSKNNIKNLPDSILNLPALEFLNISSNPLEELSNNIVQLKNLKKLYMSETNLVCLPNNIEKLKYLVTLNIALNEKICKLPVGKDFFPGLEILYIVHTPIENIQEVVKDLKNIEDLYLSSVQIVDFLGIKNLQPNLKLHILV